MAEAPTRTAARKRRLAKASEAAVPVKLRATKPRLSPLHSKVVDEWFKNGCTSKKRAMMAAGYSDSSTTTYSSVVFGREDVLAEIERRRRMRAGKAMAVTEERVIAEMATLAFTNLGDLLEVNEDGTAYFDLTQMTDAHRAALQEFSVESYTEKQNVPTGNGDETYDIISVPVKKTRIKFASKQAALDSLARTFGLFKDKTEVSLGVSDFADRIAKARERLHANVIEGKIQ